MYLSSYILFVIPLFGLLASAVPVPFFPSIYESHVLNCNPQVVERGPSIDLASLRSIQRSYGGGGGGVVDWKRAIGNSQPAPPMKQ
jgi:hypothetical protein